MLTNDLLQGEKVRLTAFKEEDAAAATSWFEQADFMRLFGASPAYPQTEKELKEMLEEERKKKNLFIFAIRTLKEKKIIGVLDLSDILWNQQVAWLAVAIGDEGSRGKGYGKEAIQLALGFAFRELNLRRVQLTVFGYNERAIALYEKLGFRREGVFREYLHRDGEMYDMYLYAILRREWEALQK